jgi:hypothetical protein
LGDYTSEPALGTMPRVIHRFEVSPYNFEVEVRDRDLIVRLREAGFAAIYYKPIGQPQLILRERSRTDDHEMLAAAWQAANAKARELGWIV